MQRLLHRLCIHCTSWQTAMLQLSWQSATLQLSWQSATLQLAYPPDVHTKELLVFFGQ